MKNILLTFSGVMLLTITVQAKAPDLKKFEGIWNFEKCSGKITHYKDQLTIKSIKGGLELTQEQLEGPYKGSNSMKFYKDYYWHKNFKKESAKSSLQRSIITKTIGGKPTVSSTWSPNKIEPGREFLSSNIAQYSITSGGKLNIQHNGSFVTKKGFTDANGNCTYTRAAKK